MRTICHVFVRSAAFLSLFLAGCAQPRPDFAPPVRTQTGVRTNALPTTAEASGFQRTATHSEVNEFIDGLMAMSPLVRRGSMGLSFEHRDIPLVIVADPPVESAAQARASGKLILFAFGSIHGGEICGKEALLALARDVALSDERGILEDAVLVFAPVYNVDGAERIAVGNRVGQIGPAEGTGERHNAQDLDLNRDYVKLASPEAHWMAAFLTEWNPHLIIDTHTTDGSAHGFGLTYAAPLDPSAHPAPVGFVRDRMFPAVSARLMKEEGLRTFFYGNFNREKTEWRTYPGLPRFGGGYRGLRGRMSILSEAYAYTTYEERIGSTYKFVRACFEFAAEERDEVVRVLDEAISETVGWGESPAGSPRVGLRRRIAEIPGGAVIPGYAMDVAPADVAGLGEPTREWEVRHMGRFEAALSAQRPMAYAIPGGLLDVVNKLLEHGVRLEMVDVPWTLGVEVDTIDVLERAEALYEGKRSVTLTTSRRRERREIPPGWFFVHTAQPLGTLLCVLLEPMSEDGLAAWGLLDAWLAEGGEYPILRIVSE